jgi:hypothetical protein
MWKGEMKKREEAEVATSSLSLIAGGKQDEPEAV